MEQTRPAGLPLVKADVGGVEGLESEGKQGKDSKWR